MSGRQRVVYQSRSARQRRARLLRMGVWAFLLLFALSVVGGLGLLASGLGR